MAIYNGFLAPLSDDAGLSGDAGATPTPTINLGIMLDDDMEIDIGFSLEDPNPKQVNEGILYSGDI